MVHVGDYAQQGGIGVIRMVLPTASFLPGCHMAGRWRGTREVSQSGSRGI